MCVCACVCVARVLHVCVHVNVLHVCVRGLVQLLSFIVRHAAYTCKPHELTHTHAHAYATNFRTCKLHTTHHTPHTFEVVTADTAVARVRDRRVLAQKGVVHTEIDLRALLVPLGLLLLLVLLRHLRGQDDIL